ncbi:outer membrane beta-barrel protein [Flavobacterium terrae]|uniref:CarboxypepD_reg-like domain-containing protein n=1 Tax=Flavobacterium terrae TaxID=415425 RepID=A0A1M6DKU7_9FLAO|nr:outer membrane beta-barrel protein [Flavobacterium terrae]SHI73781.1 CarboxypepD_reg-like domain-containing protein [Flavobacterium terrae]
MFQKSLLLALALFSLQIVAQNSIKFKGKILDEKSKLPLESVTVYVSMAKDSSLVDYTITNKSGVFSFDLKKLSNPVYLKVSMVGFEDHKINLNEISENRDFGTIILKEQAKLLGEIVIKSEAPPIRIKKDTLEFNAESFKVRPDSNVESLLKQLPGVEIDADGKISVNGKEVNQILVNGKPFFDKDGKVALQNLPSNIINKVQVTDTKTKKEEKTGANASSNNASINLTIDEKKNKGFFGKAMAGYGSSKRYESSGIINYFKNKTKFSVLASANNINSVGFSMDEVFDNMGGGRGGNRLYAGENGSYWYNGQSFGSNTGITKSDLVGINYSDEYFKNIDFSSSFFHSGTNNTNTNKTNRFALLPTGAFNTISESNTSTDSQYNNFNLTADVKIDSTLSLVLQPKLSQNDRKNYNNSQSSSYETDVLLNDFSSRNYTESNNKSFQNTATLTKTFKRKRRNVTLEVENENNENNNQSQVNSVTNFYQNSNASDIRNQKGNEKTKSENYSLSLEYSEPITDSLIVKIGAKLSHNADENKNETFDFDASTNQYSIQNDLLTMAYKSKSNELYPFAAVSLEKSKYNLYLTLGTKSIYNTNSSDYIGVITRLDKDFVLPMANFYGTYKFSKSKNIGLYYNLDYRVPSSTQLLPIQNLSNPLNTVIGNANLDINKQHSVHFSYRNYDYSTRSGYGVYSFLNYNESEVIPVTTFDQNRKRTTTYVNISGTNNFTFGTFWNKSIKKDKINYRYELRLNNSLDYDKGFIDGQMFSASTYSILPNVRFTYEWTDKITISPSYNFKKQFVNYNNYTIEKTDNLSHKLNLQVTTYWPKKWVFGNDFGYNYNSGSAANFKNDFYLWNTSLSYSFYKDLFLAKVKVYDLLNQNQSNVRNVTATEIIDQQNTVLKRYVMFSLTYKLVKFAAKEKPSRGRGMF